MIKTILIGVLLFAFTLQAQNIDLQWLDIYNGNNISGYPEMEISDMYRSGSGYIYVTGYQRNETNFSLDYVTIKYNSDGERQWIKNFDGPVGGDDVAQSLALDNFGNLYVVGSADWSGGVNYRDITVIKYSNNGDELWVRNFDGPGGSTDNVYDIELDNSNNILITGSSNSISSTDFVTLKYNSSGDFLWSKFYNGTGNASDYAYRIELDNDDNIYITGSSRGVGTGSDIVTIKYNPNGDEVWINRYNNDLANDGDSPSDMALDTFGNIYVTGSSEDVSNNDDYVTIKYNSNGDEVWVRRYNGTGNDYDGANAILIDQSGDVIITGESEGTSESNIVTIKYDTDGNEQWIKRLGTFAAGYFIASDNAGNIYVCGPGAQSQGENTEALIIKYNTSGELEWSRYWSYQGNSTFPGGFIWDNGNMFIAGSIVNYSPSDYDIFASKFSEVLQTPPAYSKVIPGDSLTIEFGTPYWGGDVNISYVSNEGTQFETSNIIASNIPSGSTEYIWNVPNVLLSYRTKIIVSNAAFPAEKIESNIFRVKPYLFTKVTSDSVYQPYNFSTDRFSFTNSVNTVWPASHFNQFNYQGIDPYTGFQYNQLIADSVFAKAQPGDVPDWLSFVRVFGVNAVYRDQQNGIYNKKAVIRWSKDSTPFGGICFGFVIANANYFMNKEAFLTKYPNFPDSTGASNIVVNDDVINVLVELYEHQRGNPHLKYDLENRGKSPNQTVNDLLEMFVDDNTQPRGLIMRNNNSGGGGHIVNPYSILKSGDNWNVNIYDNNFGNTRFVTVYPDSGNGRGTWTYSGLPPSWGGDSLFFLKDPIPPYLFTTPTLPKNGELASPFAVSDTLTVISNSYSSDIKIVDNLGRVSGYQNGMISENIPNSFADMIDTGTETPPVGFILPANNYTVELSNYTTENPAVYFENGEMTYLYERDDAYSSQVDQLRFDGNLSVKNTENVSKNSTLISLLSNSVEDKMFIVKSLNLTQNDSINVNYENDILDFTNYGITKSYDIGLEYAALGRNEIFNHSAVQIEANSKHIISPDWSDVFTNELKIFVDLGNDGTIDDTIKFINQFTDINDHGSLQPNEFRLEQNYPNPFNPTTTIKYSIPTVTQSRVEGSRVQLKVYDIIGNEIATLVNEEKAPGVYSVTFDAGKLSSGVYFYKIQAGNFVETKKMLLLK